MHGIKVQKLWLILIFFYLPYVHIHLVTHAQVIIVFNILILYFRIFHSALQTSTRLLGLPLSFLVLLLPPPSSYSAINYWRRVPKWAYSLYVNNIGRFCLYFINVKFLCVLTAFIFIPLGLEYVPQIVAYQWVICSMECHGRCKTFIEVE